LLYDGAPPQRISFVFDVINFQNGKNVYAKQSTAQFSYFVASPGHLLIMSNSYLEISAASSYQEVRFFHLGSIERVFIQLQEVVVNGGVVKHLKKNN